MKTPYDRMTMPEIHDAMCRWLLAGKSHESFINWLWGVKRRKDGKV